jgi:hypothetical protein
MRSAKKHPPLPNLALSIYIHFRELLKPEDLISLESNLQKGVQTECLQITLNQLTLNLFEKPGLFAKRIKALNRAIDLVKKYAKNPKEQREQILKQNAIPLGLLSSTILDFYLDRLKVIYHKKNPRQKLMSLIDSLARIGFPFTLKHFLEKLHARARANGDIDRSLAIFLRGEIKYIRSRPMGSAVAAVRSLRKGQE